MGSVQVAAAAVPGVSGSSCRVAPASGVRKSASSTLDQDDGEKVLEGLADLVDGEVSAFASR